jgi:hypothetical protein
LAAVAGGRLHEYIWGDATPAWSRPARVPDGRAALARLPDGGLALAEGPVLPRLMVLTPAGEVAAEVPLPAPCALVAPWPGKPGRLALAVGGDELAVYAYEIGRAAPRRLVEPRGLVRVAVPAAGGAVYGLCANGDVVRWGEDARAELLDALPPAPDGWAAFAADGRRVAALARADGAFWLHARSVT